MSAAVAATLGLVVAACSGSGSSSTTSGSPGGRSGSCPSASQNSNVTAMPGYKVCLFAGATTNANHPDEGRVVGDKVWIAWQNFSSKDGATTKPSTVSEYTTSGKLLK